MARLPKQFFLAARDPDGAKNSSSPVFTVQLPSAFVEANKCNPHYTYRVTYSADRGGMYFIGLLAGPDNLRSYSYMGLVHPETGDIRLTRASKFNESTLAVKLVKRVFANVWAETWDRIEAAGFALHHLDRCGRCGKPLTVPSSILSGLGPICAGKMGL